jgi:hypothetical protein
MNFKKVNIMVNNKLFSAVVLSVLAASSSMADHDLSAQDFSLIGIEGSYSRISSDVDTTTPPSHSSDKTKVSGIGLKVGAQSYNYRVFLTANYYKDADNSYDYITTYGIQFDYLLNVSKIANLYLGVNAGYANMKYTITGEPFSRTISDPYYGGDAGLNIHMGSLVDLELGGRMMLLDAKNVKNNTTYTFNNMISAYASLIFKYQMD